MTATVFMFTVLVNDQKYAISVQFYFRPVFHKQGRGHKFISKQNKTVTTSGSRDGNVDHFIFLD